MSTRRSPMLLKIVKARRQQIEDAKQAEYDRILRVAYVKSRKRWTVPAGAISALADARCFPSPGPNGTWTAIDTPRARSIVRAWERDEL